MRSYMYLQRTSIHLYMYIAIYICVHKCVRIYLFGNVSDGEKCSRFSYRVNAQAHGVRIWGKCAGAVRCVTAF